MHLSFVQSVPVVQYIKLLLKYGGLLNGNTRLKAECLCLTNHSERRSSLKLFTIKLFIIDGKTVKKITCAFHLFTLKSAGADENEHFL